MSLREALGLNRAAVAVLAVIGCLGLAEEIWSNFLGLHLQAQTGAADDGHRPQRCSAGQRYARSDRRL